MFSLDMAEIAGDILDRERIVEQGHTQITRIEWKLPKLKANVADKVCPVVSLYIPTKSLWAYP